MVINYETSYSYTVCEKRLFLRKSWPKLAKVFDVLFFSLFNFTSSGCMYAVTFSGVRSSPKNESFKLACKSRRSVWNNGVKTQPCLWTQCDVATNQIYGPWVCDQSEACFGNGFWKNGHCFMGTFSIQTIVIAVNFWKIKLRFNLNIRLCYEILQPGLALILLGGKPLTCIIHPATFYLVTWGYSANHPYIRMKLKKSALRFWGCQTWRWSGLSGGVCRTVKWCNKHSTL